MRRPFFVALAAGALALLIAACATMTGSERDKFEWLEEVEGEKPLAWVRERNEETLARLTAEPGYAERLADARAILTAADRLAVGSVHRGYVYNFWQDANNVRGVWRRSPLADYLAGKPVWRPVLDLDAQAKADNANWVWGGAVCQPDEGTRCMVALSDGGKDARLWAEFDLETRQFLKDGFYVPAAKTTLAWKDADTLLIATDWGPGTLTESGYPYIVKEARRGQPLAGSVQVLRGAASDMGVFLSAYEDGAGQRLILATQAETFHSATLWRLGLESPVRLRLPPKADILGLHKGEIIVRLRQDWAPPNAGLSFPSGVLISSTLSQAAEGAPRVSLIFGPGPTETIEDAEPSRHALLVSATENVRGRLMRYTFDGTTWLESQTGVPGGGAVRIASASPFEGQAFAISEDYLRPSALYAVESRNGEAKVVQSLPAKFSAAGLVTEQFFATSKDGVRVPYFVTRRLDAAMNGKTPTLLYGYGGFNISMTPGYTAVTGKLWLEKGGAFVVANIRGGGEFGPAWHEAGLKTKRQVIYDDFIAVAEDLIARGLTSSDKLGIMGGSNGGLLMGVMLTQRPDLFSAAVVQVPLLDMLGYADANMLAGASWIDEYGDPAVREERAWLAQLSPYHNMDVEKAGRAAPFFVTSTKDDRVHPAHARKMAARFEEAEAPFYYYENIDGGHSAAANMEERAKKSALEFTYLTMRLMK